MDIRKSERKFIAELKKYPNVFLFANDQSVMEGFEYYQTEEYTSKAGAIKNRRKELLANQPIREVIRLGIHMAGKVPQMLKNINRSFQDMDSMFLDLEKNGELTTSPKELVDSYPNKKLWTDFKELVWNKYKVAVGFTQVPREYVFDGKAIPFRYALVFTQEMDKEAIEKAPLLDTGMEVANVYNSLGIAVNEIAQWLRDDYKIACMANHPIGGLTDTIPLAMKAGMGQAGKSGLLITKEFGPRCRIATIYIDSKLFEFTDSNEHDWIKQFCKKCGKCLRSCPTRAIYDEPKQVIEYDDNMILNRCEAFDREKCIKSFSATMGCGVCISVCPFSKNPANYDRMKETVMKNKS